MSAIVAKATNNVELERSPEKDAVGETVECAKNKGTKRKLEEETITTTKREVYCSMEITFGEGLSATMQEVKVQDVSRPSNASFPKTYDRPEYHYEIIWDPTKEEYKKFEEQSRKIFSPTKEDMFAFYREQLISIYDNLRRNQGISFETASEFATEQRDRAEWTDDVILKEHEDYHEFAFVSGKEEEYRSMQHDNIAFVARPDEKEGEDDDDYKFRVMTTLPWSRLNTYDDDFEDDYELKEEFIKARRTGLLEAIGAAVEDQWFSSYGWHKTSIGGRGYGVVQLYVPAKLMAWKYVDEEVEKLRSWLDRQYYLDEFDDNLWDLSNEKELPFEKGDKTFLNNDKWANFGLSNVVWYFE